MTDTPKNIAPPNHPHAALQLLYAEERKDYTAALFINTKGQMPIMPRPEELPEGKSPSWNGA